MSKIKPLDYTIIASSSRGNAVRVEDMLFDAGVPFASLREELYEVKYVLITHGHSDHLHLPTVNRIKKEFPRIRWIGNYDVVVKVLLDEVVGDDTVLEFKDRKIQSFPCVHDVPTHGFVVEWGDKRLIYAVDTHSLEYAPKGKYDYLFLESNHDEKKIEMIRNDSRKRFGYDAWEGAMRHLSTQKSKAFYYIHRSSPDAPWVELHKSERFY